MSGLREVLPKTGILYNEDVPSTVLCKPKIMPLKSVTLEKLDKMQKEAQDAVKQQDLEESKIETDAFGQLVEKHAGSASAPPDVLGEGDL